VERFESCRATPPAQCRRDPARAEGEGDGLGAAGHALIAALLGTRLRVSELLAIDVIQYEARRFMNVFRKGRQVHRFIPLQKQHREVLDQWLEERGPDPGPIFRTRSGKRLDRTQAFLILKRAAQQANAHLPPAQHLEVSPYVLRHTLLRNVANEKGVHYAAMELSGHRSDRYI
jgi:integrase/recombinase XerD